MLIYMIAGEPSGDLLGARLIAALRKLSGDKADFAGVGGEAMRAEGLQSLFLQKDIAVMGLAEILPHLPTILKRLDQTMQDIAQKKPDVIITIDSWGFTGRIARRLKKQNSQIPRIHYVAPMVWAWKEKRVHDLARCVDFLMCLLPDEPPMFERAGLPAAFVGHPVLEGGADQGSGAAFREKYQIAEDKTVLTVLPGSRTSEVGRLLPVFQDTIQLLAQTRSDLHLVLPTVETVVDEVRSSVKNWPVPVTLVEGAKERYNAFAASRAALAASGTVALELALAKLPMLIAYKVAPLTGFLARRLLKIRYVCLLNLLEEREIVPEFLQENCQAEIMAPALASLLKEGAVRQKQLQGSHDALQKLGFGGEQPSFVAANHVLRYIEEKKEKQK